MGHKGNRVMRVARGMICGLVMAAPALAQGDGFDFVTIGSPGNHGYDRQDINGFVRGRGSVAYEYQIARTEVSTAQWMDFVNVISTHPEWGYKPYFEFVPVTSWGASVDRSYSGPGRRFVLLDPSVGKLPVQGITWRAAAMFCNWLTNDRAPTLAAVTTGAYDAATFTQNPDGTYNDQVAHSPSAKYYIPSQDEWLKAVHYDPRKDNGAGGWWLQPNGTDTPLLPGPPGVGQTSAGYQVGLGEEWYIPIGAYANVLTPWGLLDASGGASEWTESLYADPTFRILDGTNAGSTFLEADEAQWFGAQYPFVPYSGIRLAAPIPAPSASAALICSLIVLNRRRRRLGGVGSANVSDREPRPPGDRNTSCSVRTACSAKPSQAVAPTASTLPPHHKKSPRPMPEALLFHEYSNPLRLTAGGDQPARPAASSLPRASEPGGSCPRSCPILRGSCTPGGSRPPRGP